MKKILTLTISMVAAAMMFACANKSLEVANQKVALIEQYTAKLDSVATLEEFNAANEQFQLAIININQTAGQGVTLEAADSARVGVATSALEAKMMATSEKIQAIMQEELKAAIAADSVAKAAEVPAR